MRFILAARIWLLRRSIEVWDDQLKHAGALEADVIRKDQAYRRSTLCRLESL